MVRKEDCIGKWLSAFDFPYIPYDFLAIFSPPKKPISVANRCGGDDGRLGQVVDMRSRLQPGLLITGWQPLNAVVK